MMELHFRNEPRPCVVRQDGMALCHGFYVRAWTHGAAATIGGFSAGQEAVAMALVEYPDGMIDSVAADAVRMLDSAEVFRQYSFEEESHE